MFSAKNVFRWSTVLYLCGCALFVYLLYGVMTETTVDGVTERFDPYEIMGISSVATESEIKKAYKLLSLKYHPDKVAEDDTESQDMFIRISKAYKVLTDPDAKAIFDEYGHPDGRQSFSYGIALPQWLIEGGNKNLVLAVYAFLFGIVLPVVVGRWWGTSKKYARDGVLNYTMAMYFRELKEQSALKPMFELACASVELRDEIEWRGDVDMQAVMALFRQVKDVVQAKTGNKLELPKKYNAPYVYKSFVLLYAHLFRVPVQDVLLQRDYQRIIPKLHHLITKGLLHIPSSHFWLRPSLHCVEMARMLVQAVPGSAYLNSGWLHTESSEFHQLPYFDAERIKQLKMKKRVKNMEEWMALPLGERVDFLRETGLDNDKIRHVLQVARRIPIVTIEHAGFRCVSEEKILPGSFVTFEMRLKAMDYRGEGLKVAGGEDENLAEFADTLFLEETQDWEVDEELEKQVQGEEEAGEFLGGDDEDSPRSSRLTKLLSGTYWQNPNPPAYTPYYPDYSAEEDALIRPRYWMWLCNPRMNRMVSAPTQISRLVPVPKHLDREGSLRGRRLVKFRMYAPQEAGTYQFTLLVMSDAYLSTSLEQTVKLQVVKADPREEQRRQAEQEKYWEEYDKDEEEFRQMMMGGSQSLLGAPTARVVEDSSSDEETDDGETDSDSE